MELGKGELTDQGVWSAYCPALLLFKTEWHWLKHKQESYCYVTNRNVIHYAHAIVVFQTICWITYSTNNFFFFWAQAYSIIEMLENKFDEDIEYQCIRDSSGISYTMNYIFRKCLKFSFQYRRVNFSCLIMILG